MKTIAMDWSLVIVLLHVLPILNYATDTATEEIPTLERAFTDWFIKEGGTINKLEVASFGMMGRGFAVTEPIDEDEDLLHIPSKLIFSRLNLHKHVKNKAVFNALDSLGPEGSIVAWLLYEKSLCSESFFESYIKILPEYVPSLLHYTTDELSQLQNPELASESIDLQRSAQRDYKSFVAAVSSIWPGGATAVSNFDDYLWACTMINSRGLRFQGEIYMAPMADIFNYAPHPMARDPQSGEFFLKHHKLNTGGGRRRSSSSGSGSSTAVDKGSITISADRTMNETAAVERHQYLEDYGDNPDEIYFKYHGFVPQENPFRCVRLNLGSSAVFGDRFLGGAGYLSHNQKQLLSALQFRRPPNKCIDPSGKLGLPLAVFVAVVSFTEKEVKTCLSAVKKAGTQVLEAFDTCGFYSAQSFLERKRSAALSWVTDQVVKEEQQLQGQSMQDDVSTLQEVAEELDPNSLHGRLLAALHSIFAQATEPFVTTPAQDLISLSAGVTDTDGVSDASSKPRLRQQMTLKYRFNLKQLWRGLCDMYGAACSAIPATPSTEELLTLATADEKKIPSLTPVPPPQYPPSSVPALSPVLPPKVEPSGAPALNPVAPPQEVATDIPALNPVHPPREEPSSVPTPGPVSAPSEEPSSTPAGTPISPPTTSGKSESYSAQQDATATATATASAASATAGSTGSTTTAVKMEPTESGLTLAEKLQRFNDWFSSLGPKPSLLRAQEIPGFRVGTITTEDIPKNTLYIGVPVQSSSGGSSGGSGGDGVKGRERPPAVLNSEIALTNSSVSPLVQQLMETYRRRDDFHELLFLLLQERFVLGEQSFYWPYLSLLPSTDEMDIPLMWSPEQVQQRLGASQLVNSILKYQSTTQRRFQILQKMEIITPKFFSPEVFTFENFRWASAILDSRSIWWSGRRNLVPMLDFVNCMEDADDPDRLHSTVLDPTGAYAITYSGRSYKKGEQLFENYGQPNHIYFVYHGFVLHENSHDCAHIELHLTQQDLDRLDIETAQPVMNKLRLSTSQPSSLSACLTIPVPESIWAFLAVKSNTVAALAQAELVGRPNAAGITTLLELLGKRIEEHIKFPRSSHVAANSFLDTEISVLRRVKAQLEIDLSSMTKVTASIVSGSPRGRGTKVTFEFEEYGDDEL